MKLEHATEAELNEVKKWFFKENVRIQQQKKELEEEKEKIQKLKQDFEEESRGFLRTKTDMERERKLLDIKWKMLEQELSRISEDKQQVEEERRNVRNGKKQTVRSFRYEVFFVGVNSKQALKKRYKDLQKIFHPDNMNGDEVTIQEINREYEELCKKFE